MTPYSSLTYFVILALLLAPMGAAALRGKVSHRWILLCTLLMLFVQYALPLHGTSRETLIEFASMVAWGLIQLGILRAVIHRGAKRGSALWSVPLSVLPLVIVKAGSAWMEGWNVGFSGISYVTFRALDVLWSISDGALKTVGIADFLTFMFFFPTLSSGPIDRFKRFQAEWRKDRSAAEFWTDVDAGIGHVFHGLLYKFVIATMIDRYVLGHSGAVPGFPGAMQYGLTWGLYLFFDFAGYSAFAVGISRCFGIYTPENFKSPWSAPNVREFWNRWHISLSAWFRDHIYMRFLLMARRKKWFANPNTASMAAYYVSFGTMGLWHGFTLNYIGYGLYHATLLTLCDAFGRWRKAHPQHLTGRLWPWCARALTVACVSFGFWMFSGHGWIKPGTSNVGFFSSKFFGNHHKHVGPVPED